MSDVTWRVIRAAALALLSGPLGFGCDDGASADPRPDGAIDAATDGGADAGSDAGGDAGHDLGDDAAPPGDGGAADRGPDATPPCPASPAEEGVQGLASLPIVRSIPLGSGAASGAFLVEDLDGAPDGAAEVVVARGGRLEAYDAAGRALWNTGLRALDTLWAVADVDGDGRREVLATGGTGAWWFDALTGAELWRLPAAPFRPDDPPIVGVLAAHLTDLDADDLPDLYLTDTGCSGGGTGFGVAFGFRDGFATPNRLGVVAEPRVGGRCARWHSVSDVDGDGRPEVLRPDAIGIQAMDPRNGQRVLCGEIPGVVGDTRLPHLPLKAADGPRWAVFDRGRLIRLAARLDPALCPGGRGALLVEATLDLGDAVRPEGSAAIDLDGDGVDELLTSVRLGSTWQVVAIAGDAVQVLRADALLEGVLGGDPPRLLVREQPAEAPARFDALMLYAHGPALEPLWPQAIVGAPHRLPNTRADRTAEFGELAQLAGRPLVLVADPERRAATALRLVADGRFVNRPLLGEPGGLRPVCGAAGCRQDRLAFSTADGCIGVLDPTLALADAEGDRPAVCAPTGLAQLDAVPGIGLMATTVDRLVRLDPAGDEPIAWSIGVGRGRRTDALGYAADLLVIRAHARSPTTWLALGSDGAIRWQHALDPSAFRVLAGGLTAPDVGLVYRFDFVEDMAAWPPEPPCADRADPEIRAPLLDCPDQPTTARMVTALDATTGQCRWRVTLRPTRCGSPTNQNISRIDDRLFVTSTNELVVLSTADGAELGRTSLGFVGVAGRGGGQVIRADDALIRFGGNGPVDVHALDLRLRWRADAQDIRGQSWLFRPALAVGDAVWISPAAQAPIQRYALDATGEDALPIGETPLADGAILEAGALGADVRSLQLVSALDGERGGVAITTDEPWLYALAPDGGLLWSRAFPAAIGSPVIADLDGDGAREMAIPVGDGRVLIADGSDVAPPAVVWDLPCPATRSCDPDRDIDETDRTDRLCAEWLPREGVMSYEVRAVDVNGAVLRDWFAVGPNTTAAVQGLALVPGARYRIEVRSRSPRGPSAPATSDGVQVVDDPPPQVELTALPDALGPGQLSRITVRARDDEQLAGWAMIVRTAETGALVQRLGAGPLAQPEFEATRDWLGDDRAKNPVPPGAYEIVATFEDRAGNVGSATAVITVCAGACP